MDGEEAGSTPLTAGTRIWLLPRGSRGDVQPFVALALGLQKAGVQVKVFAAGLYEKLFSTYGVPFERTDLCLFWRNEEVVRQLRERASSHGLSGPQEYCDLLQQRKYEFVSFFTMKSWKDRTPSTKFMAWLNGTESTYNMLWRGGEDLDFAEWSKWEEERHQEYLQAQAAANKTTAEDFELLLRKRREAYMASLAALAVEHGRTLQDFNDLLHDELSQYISQIFTSSFVTAGRTSGQVVSELMSFNSWQAGSCNLEKYWAEWRGKLPGLGQLWHEGAGACNTKCGQVQVWNVLAAASALPREELPDLVLFPPAMLSTALELKKKHGLNVLLTTTRPPCLQSAAQQMAFSLLTMEEKATRLFNLQEMGPVAFSDLLRNPRQLFGIGPDELPPEAALPQVCKSSHVWLQSIEAHLRGHWHLTAEQELHAAAEPCLFGGQRAKELLDGYLAAAPEAPVFIGFGSSQHPGGPKALARLAVGALKLAGRRGMFFSSWGRLTQATMDEGLREASEKDGLGDLSDFAKRHVLFLRAAPHEWLFPQCACVVHQPGVGTTDAALRAGVPQVLSEALGGSAPPVTRQLVEHLNVGKLLKPGTLGELTAQQVAESIKAVLDDSTVREAVKEVAAEHRRLAAVERVAERLGSLLLEDELDNASVVPPGEVGTDIYGRELSENPWADGMYHLFTPKGEFGGRAEILGSKVFVIGLETPFCWLRALSDTEVEGFFQSSVDVAQLSEDGETFKWGSGQEFRLRSITLARSCEKSCECTVA